MADEIILTEEEKILILQRRKEIAQKKATQEAKEKAKQTLEALPSVESFFMNPRCKYQITQESSLSAWRLAGRYPRLYDDLQDLDPIDVDRSKIVIKHIKVTVAKRPVVLCVGIIGNKIFSVAEHANPSLNHFKYIWGSTTRESLISLDTAVLKSISYRIQDYSKMCKKTAQNIQNAEKELNYYRGRLKSDTFTLKFWMAAYKRIGNKIKQQ